MTFQLAEVNHTSIECKPIQDNENEPQTKLTGCTASGLCYKHFMSR